MEEKKETKKTTVKKTTSGKTTAKKATSPAKKTTSTTKKTTSTAKKEVKKVVKPEVKKEVKEVKPERIEEEFIPTLPEEEPFGVRFRRFVSSYKFLYTTFAILLIIVVVLGIMVFTRSHEEKTTDSNIIFSIMEENTNNSLNMDLETLIGNVYALKVTNYRGDKVNSNEVHYTIKVTNDTDVEIEILKNDEGENLMTDQKESVIEGEPFGTEEMEEVIYYFRVTNSDNIKKGDSIQIEVAS